MPRELLAVRLDASERARLLQVARLQRRSASELVREALSAWIARHEREALFGELARDLIGCVAGPPDLSRQVAGRGPQRAAPRRRSARARAAARSARR